MTAVGLAEAARLTGKNVSTIHRAMKAGRLSYALSTAGERQIDTAELARVFGISIEAVNNLAEVNGVTTGIDAVSMRRNSAHRSEIAVLHRLVDEQAASIADLRATIREQGAGLDDLRRRLDASETERRQLSERLTGLLTHRQGGSVPTVPAVPIGRSWWRRWFR
jgi:septal ring factor EnvC (AmiA/AmiB activator)